MIQIGKAIVSFDIFEKKFLCDIATCKGICCVEGDSGAPLTSDEAQIIEKYYPIFKEYISPQFQDEIKEKGFSVIDSDGDLVTPIHEDQACLFTFEDSDGITKCAIEKAYFEGKIDFRKPISCHLFPIRIKEYKEFDAVNYQQLNVCKCARKCGAKAQLPLYKFLKEPLIRKYGEEWYKELEIAADYLRNEQISGSTNI